MLMEIWRALPEMVQLGATMVLWILAAVLGFLAGNEWGFSGAMAQLEQEIGEEEAIE